LDSHIGWIVYGRKGKLMAKKSSVEGMPKFDPSRNE
jgi:hypothetical protein